VVEGLCTAQVTCRSVCVPARWAVGVRNNGGGVFVVFVCVWGGVLVVVLVLGCASHLGSILAPVRWEESERHKGGGKGSAGRTGEKGGWLRG
jgi:hypothetical protein